MDEFICRKGGPSSRHQRERKRMNQVWKSAPNLEKNKGIPYQNMSHFYAYGTLDDTRKTSIDLKSFKNLEILFLLEQLKSVTVVCSRMRPLLVLLQSNRGINGSSYR